MPNILAWDWYGEVLVFNPGPILENRKSITILFAHVLWRHPTVEERFYYTYLFHCCFAGAPVVIPFFVWDSIIDVVMIEVEEVLQNEDTCYVMLWCWFEAGGVNKFLIWKVVFHKS
jgi:hypothetical protein